MKSCCSAFEGLDGSVVLSVISQLDLLWEDNINWEVFPIVRFQKKVLFLAQEITIFRISKPHFTFWKKHNPGCTQDNKTRKQAQYNKTYHLASTQQGICILDCFLHSYFQDFLLMHGSMMSFWGWLVILHMLCLHINFRMTCVFAGMFAGHTSKFWFTDAFESSLRVFTACPSILA